MEDAQRESIGFNVGTACLIPFDVGGFDAKGGFPQADVKPADSTGIPVHGQDTHAKLGITCGTGDRLDLQGKSYSVLNIFMDGLWEVPLQEVRGNLDKQPWMVTEYSIDRCRKPTTDLVSQEFAFFLGWQNQLE